jgi:23S rRNA (cytidine1920-2'-O)/16S rRNA (cytidine1409-2'-O)-methyltransferase
MTRRRLDAELVRRGLAATADEARRAVGAGRVRIGGITAMKAATMVSDDAPVAVVTADPGYVSRGGGKLAAALDRFGVDPISRDCLDAGASTGGFTDVLLRRGAGRVLAVDVGYGLLAWGPRSDPRVTVLERTNVRSLTRGTLPFVPDLVVADLSFVSLGSVVGVLAAVASSEADHILLVKPQFEAGPGAVGPGGVVRDPAVWRAAIERVVDASRAAGLRPRGVMASPLPGPAGNVEFPLHLSAGPSAGRSAGLSAGDRPAAFDLDAAIREGEGLRR